MQLLLRDPEMTGLFTMENLAEVCSARSISCSESVYSNPCRILIYLLASKSVVSIYKEIGQDQSRSRKELQNHGYAFFLKV